jgi:hypothetical protein
MAEHQIVRNHPEQDEKDAWDAYASAALTALITTKGDDNPDDVVAWAATFANLMLEERRKVFPSKPSQARSEPLKL